MLMRPFCWAMPMSKQATAYHEAGHAVVGRVLGLTCGGASIVPDVIDGSAGHAITPDPHRSIDDWEARGRWRYVSMLRAQIMTLMAGREAEIECLGAHAGGDGSDQAEAASHLDETCPPAVSSDPEEDRNRFEVRLRARTRGVARRHLRAIDAVAHALLRADKLSAHEIDEIVRPYTRLPKRVDSRKVTAEERCARADRWRTAPGAAAADWRLTARADARTGSA
jgi:hypothetical protein